MIFLPFFALDQSFSDPHTIKLQYPDNHIEEVDYAPWKYKSIVRECVEISEAINTSYVDLMKISPTERKYIYEFLKEKSDKLKERLKQTEDQIKQNNKTPTIKKRR